MFQPQFTIETLLLYGHECFNGKPMISLTSSLSLKLYLDSSVYYRNIFGFSSDVFGNLQKSSEIFRNFRKCSGTFDWPSQQFWEIFGKWSKIFGKSSKTPSSLCLWPTLEKSDSLGTKSPRKRLWEYLGGLRSKQTRGI